MLDLLSKLLANENITLKRGKYKTASFDVKNRELRLPMFTDMSLSEELMLIFHEVGHALYTGLDYFELIKQNETKYPQIRSYMNVIEDARIERLIKRLYPGSRKEFYAGYKSLNERDFFGTLYRDISNCSLIDRINLHYKCASITVNFSEKEQQFISRIDKLETVQQVADISIEIMEFCRNKQNVTPDEKKEHDELEAGEYSDEQSPGEDISPEETTEEDSDEIESPCGECEVPESVTQDSFDDRISDSANSKTAIFLVPPKLSSPYFFCDFDRFSSNQGSEKTLTYNQKKIKDSTRRAASYMFREFEMKKNADRYARSSVAKSGAINTSKLVSYKTSFDIFKKYKIELDEKNHGMVLFLDFSGSMKTTIMGAITEVYTLATFCNMAKIPFRFFAVVGKFPPMEMGDFPETNKELGKSTPGIHSSVKNRYTTFVEIATSSSSFRDVEQSLLKMTGSDYAGFQMNSTPMVQALLFGAEIIPQFKAAHNLQKVSLIVITDGKSDDVRYIDQNGEQAFEPKQTFISDPSNGKLYSLKDRSALEAILLLLKARHSYLKILGFFVVHDICTSDIIDYVIVYRPKRNRGDCIPEAKFLVSTAKGSTIKTTEPGYDSMVIFEGNKISENFEIIGVTANSSAAKVAKAFSAGLSAGIKNKILLSNVVSTIC